MIGQWGLFWNDDQDMYLGKLAEFTGYLYVNEIDHCAYEHFQPCSDEQVEIIKMIEENDEVITYFHKMLNHN